MITLNVRNYRAIIEGSIELAPLALVASCNEGGKTSLAQALAAVIIGSSVVVEDVKKSEAGLLIHSGASKAEIELTGNGGSARIPIPGSYATKGERPPRASEYALGIKSILDMDRGEQAKTLLEYLKALPNIDDLREKLAGVSESALGVIWKSVTELGWDGAHQRAADTGKKLKGQWEDRTGERWGSNKAQIWVPQGWSTELEGMSEESLKGEISTAKSILETAVGQAAVSSTDRERLQTLAGHVTDLNLRLKRAVVVAEEHSKSLKTYTENLAVLRNAAGAHVERDQLEVSAARIPDIQREIEAQRKNLNDAKEKLAAAEKKLASLPKPEEAPPLLSPNTPIWACPHCKNPVAAVAGRLVIPPNEQHKAAHEAARKESAQRETTIQMAAATVRGKREVVDDETKKETRLLDRLSEAQADKAKLEAMGEREATKAEAAEITSLEDTLASTREAHEKALREVGSLENSMVEAEAAKTKLDGLPEAVVDEAEVEHHREGVRIAEDRLRIWSAKTGATRIANNIELNLQIVAALAPTGVRQTKLAASLSDFNVRLTKLCQTAGWRAVTIDRDLDISYGYQYRLLSESAQYRVRTIIQIAMAQLDGSDLMIFDRADILDSGPPDGDLVRGRPGLIRLLAALKIPALVCLTDRRDRLPDLQAMGLGNSYWIQNGKIESHVIQRAAEAA